MQLPSRSPSTAQRCDSLLVCADCFCMCVLRWKQGRHHAVLGKAFWFLTLAVLCGYGRKLRQTGPGMKKTSWSYFVKIRMLLCLPGMAFQTSSGMKETKRPCFVKIGAVPCCVWRSFLAANSCLLWAAMGGNRAKRIWYSGVRDNDLTLISFYKRFHLSSFRIIENKLQYIKFVNVEKSHRLEGRLV